MTRILSIEPAPQPVGILADIETRKIFGVPGYKQCERTCALGNPQSLLKVGS